MGIIMKKILTFAVVVLVAAACVNTNKKPKSEPEAPAGEPAVEAPVQVVAPVQKPVEKEEPAPAPEEKKTEEAAAPLTVDALCNQFGVYDLLNQYQQSVQDKDKKAARKLETQLGALQKQIKNDESLPKDLRESFKTYIEDKEEEIKARFK
jgi:flagellar motility protein MotE (MotC chaperone)